MKKIFGLLIICAMALATSTVNAQTTTVKFNYDETHVFTSKAYSCDGKKLNDHLDSMKVVPMTATVEIPAANGGNSTANASANASASAPAKSDNTWLLALLALTIMGCALLYALLRNNTPLSIHHFNVRKTVKGLSTNGGEVKHTVKSRGKKEKISVKVLPASKNSVELARIKSAQPEQTNAPAAATPTTP